MCDLPTHRSHTCRVEGLRDEWQQSVCLHGCLIVCTSHHCCTPLHTQACAGTRTCVKQGVWVSDSQRDGHVSLIPCYSSPTLLSHAYAQIRLRYSFHFCRYTLARGQRQHPISLSLSLSHKNTHARNLLYRRPSFRVGAHSEAVRRASFSLVDHAGRPKRAARHVLIRVAAHKRFHAHIHKHKEISLFGALGVCITNDNGTSWCVACTSEHGKKTVLS